MSVLRFNYLLSSFHFPPQFSVLNSNTLRLHALHAVFLVNNILQGMFINYKTANDGQKGRLSPARLFVLRIMPYEAATTTACCTPGEAGVALR